MMVVAIQPGDHDHTTEVDVETAVSVLALLDWVFKSLEKVGQLLYNIVKTVTSAVTWPAWEVMYETVILPLWEVSENIWMVLVHLGYLQPQSEQFYADENLKRPNEIDKSLIKLGHSIDSTFQEALFLR